MTTACRRRNQGVRVRPVSSRGGHRRTAAGGRPWSALLVLAVVALSGCALDDAGGEVDPTATVVELPGPSGDIDFDDIAYSAELQRVLVPAGNSGVYLVEPTTAEATRVEGVTSVDSVDAGEGVLFVLDRSEEQISVVDPQDGKGWRRRRRTALRTTSATSRRPVSCGSPHRARRRPVSRCSRSATMSPARRVGWPSSRSRTARRGW